MIDETVLTESIGALRTDIEARRAELRTLSEALQHAERELQLMVELAHLRGIPVDGEPAADGDGASSLLERAPGAEENQLQEAVIGILRAAGTPIHIQDLLARVRESGAEIPGRGTSANLIGSISSNPAIVRPVRGMYGLREWGLSDRPTHKKRPSRSRSQSSRGKRRQRRSNQPAARPAPRAVPNE